MSLKQHTVRKREVTEQAIAAVIADRCKYDVELGEVVLLPAFSALRARLKILVYLVALRGWQFLKPGTGSERAGPTDIARAVGLPSGTVKPLLRELATGNILHARNGAYMVPDHNIAHVERLLSGEAQITSQAERGRTRGKRATRGSSPSSRRRSAPSKPGVRKLIQDLVRRGFFAKPKTLTHVQAALRDRGYVYELNSLSGPMQRITRADLLRREKAQHGKKSVYEYRAPRTGAGEG